MGLAMTDFKEEVARRTADQANDELLRKAALEFLQASVGPKYSYNFHWLDRPIIQYPQDIVAIQELIWELRPDLVIETGIAHGGSLVLSASMLAMLDMCEAIKAGKTIDPAQSRRRVLGVDIDIREHNRAALDMHPMRSRMEMMEGPSTEERVLGEVRQFSKDFGRILVCLDSNHTHDHVRAELEAYAPLVSVGSYCVVFDTLIEDMPHDTYSDRPWGPGNNPMTAVQDFLQAHSEYECDHAITDRLAISAARGGYLKRIA